MSPTELITLPQVEARKIVRASTDLSFLRAVLEAEQSDEDRVPWVNMLRLRIDMLAVMQDIDRTPTAPHALAAMMLQVRSDDPAPAVEDLPRGDEDLPRGPAEPSAPAPETIPEAVGRSRSYMAGRYAFAEGKPLSTQVPTGINLIDWSRGWTEANDLVQSEPGFFRSHPCDHCDPADHARGEHTPAVPAAPPALSRSPVDVFAVNLVRAARDGNERMLAALVGVLRSREYGADEVAAAMVVAYRSEQPVVARSRKPVSG